MKVIPDFNTVVPYLQTLPFLLSLLILHFVLFKPLLRYLAARESATAGARREAAELDAEVALRLEDLQGRLHEARLKSRELRSEAHDRAVAAEQKVVTTARREAEGRTDEAIAQVQSEADAARATLRTLATTLSREIAEQILGRSTAT